MNNTNNVSARQAYEHARKMFSQAFAANFTNPTDLANFVNGLKLSQSEIRLEVGLSANNNTFQFGVNPNQVSTSNIVFNTENRLNQQDSLCVNEYGIYVGQPTSNTDTSWQLLTYGNPNIFAAADAAALNSTFYSHGSLQIKCNNDVLMPYRGLFNHLYKPQTQQTAALGAGSPADQIRGAEDGQITEEPNIVLIGSKGNVPIITLPTNLASVGAFSRVILIFRGILAQNSTVVS